MLNQSLGGEDPLEKGMATPSSILAWKIPYKEEPGRYSPRGRKESDTTEASQHIPSIGRAGHSHWATREGSGAWAFQMRKKQSDNFYSMPKLV